MRKLFLRIAITKQSLLALSREKLQKSLRRGQNSDPGVLSVALLSNTRIKPQSAALISAGNDSLDVRLREVCEDSILLNNLRGDSPKSARATYC